MILHRIYTIKDRKIIIELPETFSATNAEVIILSLQSPETIHDKETAEKAEIIERFLTRDTTHFTDEQKKAYERILQALKQETKPHSPRTAGLFAGLVQTTEDFDAPLPDEFLFWGAETDEYGITLADESPA